ncbi:MAG: FtsX-like permease family protein [Bdellovibrionales bacterium]|nr:FtsX-like permease family protein [Bdellovibrionales bacterium]
MWNLFRLLRIRNLKHKPSRFILTTLGVAIGISLFVAIAIINHSTKNSMRESIESISGKAKLSVTAGPAGFDESKQEVIRTTPGVKYAVPMIEARAFFEGAKESSDGLNIMGVDLLQETSVRSYKATDQRIIDDPLTFLNQPDSIVITIAQAQKRGLKLDDKIQLATALGVKTFTIRGLLEPEGAAKAYGGSLAIMDIDGARVMFGKENKIDRIDVVPTKDADVETVRAAIEKNLGPGFTIETPGAQSEQTERMLTSYQVVLTFFSTLALLVGLFLVINSISVSVAEQRKEIGTLRALGATRFSMVTMFVVEVFVVGSVGSLLGCLGGRVLAEKLVNEVTASVGAQIQTQIQVTKLEFTPQLFIFTLVMGTVAAIFAALIPALRAAKVHPLESMKKHQENQTDADVKRGHLSVIIGFVMLVVMTFSMSGRWEKIWIGFDLYNKGAAVLGSALFGPFLVFILIRSLRKLTRGLSSPVFRLAQENLVRSRKRTASNVMALLVGLFLVMMIATVRTSFHDTTMKWINGVFVADLMVTSNGKLITADVQPLKEEVEADLLKIPGVKAIGPGRGTGSRIVHFQHNGKHMRIKAFDHFADFYEYQMFDIKNADRIETAKELYDTDEPRMIVTSQFLTKQGYHVGQTVPLDTPSGAIPFKIIGMLTDFASPEGVIYMDRAQYKKYWKDSLVTGFFINAADGHSVEELRSTIDRELGRKWNLVVVSNAEFKNEMHTMIEKTFAYTKAIEFIALLVGLLGLLNTLLISVMERKREIGMLRAIGSTQSQISNMILIEAVLQGFFGAIIAVVLGVYVGRLFVTFTLSSTLGWIVDFYFPRASVWTTIWTGVGVAAIAGLLPARRAAKTEILEALDYE